MNNSSSCVGGSVVITREALDKVKLPFAMAALVRHAAGDWGDVDEDDRKQNDFALQLGDRLLSVYHTSDGTKFWIITEADRSATTILLPEDY